MMFWWIFSHKSRDTVVPTDLSPAKWAESMDYSLADPWLSGDFWGSLLVEKRFDSFTKFFCPKKLKKSRNPSCKFLLRWDTSSFYHRERWSAKVEPSYSSYSSQTVVNMVFVRNWSTINSYPCQIYHNNTKTTIPCSSSWLHLQLMYRTVLCPSTNSLTKEK